MAVLLPKIGNGGAIGLDGHFGMRAVERLPGESCLPRCLFCQKQLEWFEAYPLFGWLLRKNYETMPCSCGKRKNLWFSCAGAH